MRSNARQMAAGHAGTPLVALLWAAAVPLALAKQAGAPLWIMLLFDRRWRALAWAAGLSAAGLLVTGFR